VSWVECRDSHVIGCRYGRGEPKCSPLMKLTTRGHCCSSIFFHRRVGIGRNFGRKLYLTLCRSQQWQHFQVSRTFLEVLLGCFLLCFDSPSENLSPVIGGEMTTPSTLFPYWGVALEIMTCLTYGGMARRAFEELKSDGEEDRSLIFFFLYLSVFSCFFLFLGVSFRV
jgi:hypothetical protein